MSPCTIKEQDSECSDESSSERELNSPTTMRLPPQSVHSHRSKRLAQKVRQIQKNSGNRIAPSSNFLFNISSKSSTNKLHVRRTHTKGSESDLGSAFSGSGRSLGRFGLTPGTTLVKRRLSNIFSQSERASSRFSETSVSLSSDAESLKLVEKPEQPKAETQKEKDQAFLKQAI